MRNIIIIFSLIVLSAWTFSESQKDVLGVEGPLIFNGVSFSLSEVEQLDSVTTVQTYLSEKNDEYMETLYIHIILNTDSARERVADKVLTLAERKEFDFFCEYGVMEAPNGKEFILNYREVFQTLNQPSKINFTCRHYSSLVLANGTPAIMIYGYSRKYISDDINEAVAKVERITQGAINAMIMGEKPAIQMRNSH